MSWYVWDLTLNARYHLWFLRRLKYHFAYKPTFSLVTSRALISHDDYWSMRSMVLYIVDIWDRMFHMHQLSTSPLVPSLWLDFVLQCFSLWFWVFLQGFSFFTLPLPLSLNSSVKSHFATSPELTLIFQLDSKTRDDSSESFSPLCILYNFACNPCYRTYEFTYNSIIQYTFHTLTQLWNKPMYI